MGVVGLVQVVGELFLIGDDTDLLDPGALATHGPMSRGEHQPNNERVSEKGAGEVDLSEEHQEPGGQEKGTDDDC